MVRIAYVSINRWYIYIRLHISEGEDKADVIAGNIVSGYKHT